MFYAIISATSVGVVAPQLFALALPIAVLFGYLLPDIDNSIKAMIACQGVTWLIVIAVLDIFSPDFRDLLLISNPSKSAALALVVIVGIGIFWFFLGLIGSLLGIAVHHLKESRERQKPNPT